MISRKRRFALVGAGSSRFHVDVPRDRSAPPGDDVVNGDLAVITDTAQLELDTLADCRAQELDRTGLHPSD